MFCCCLVDPQDLQVPFLDGFSSPFADLSLAKQSAMRLPPLERPEANFLHKNGAVSNVGKFP